MVNLQLDIRALKDPRLLTVQGFKKKKKPTNPQKTKNNLQKAVEKNAAILRISPSKAQ